jgi:hypothetical protein
MPPKDNKRKRSPLGTFRPAGRGTPIDQIDIDARLEARQQARVRREAAERALPRGFDANQRVGFPSRRGTRGLHSTARMAQRSAKGYTSNVNSQSNETSIFNQRKQLKLTIARARARGAVGSATLHERMLHELETRMKDPARYKWDDEGKDFVERGPGGDYFWIHDRGSRREGDDDGSAFA